MTGAGAPRATLKKAAAVVMAAAVLFTCSGCSEEALEGLGDALGDAYEAYGPGHMHWTEGHEFYPYRYDMCADSFQGEACAEINGGKPLFGRLESEGWPEGISSESGPGWYREYGVLPADTDEDPEDGPTVDPPGWSGASYPGAVDGGTLWRRYLLIPEDLGGAYGRENMRCCTAYAWTAGIEPLERMVRDYLSRGPGRRAAYRVTAITSGLDDIPQGFLIECRSMDGGNGLEFCGYVYNVQPGIGIGYSDGSSWMEAAGKPDDGTEDAPDPGA